MICRRALLVKAEYRAMHLIVPRKRHCWEIILYWKKDTGRDQVAFL